MGAGCAIDQPDCMEIFDCSVRAAAYPVRRLYLDELAENDFLRRFFGHLTEHSRGWRFVIIKAAAWHTPSAGHSGSSRVLGSQQAAARRHYCVRGKTLPDNRSYLAAEYQPGVASLPAYHRTCLIAYRTYKEPKNEISRAGPVGVKWADDDVAAVEREHIRVGAMIEAYLERVSTLLGDADDQHLVIMAQLLLQAGLLQARPST
jgi:hypothetical protein